MLATLYVYIVHMHVGISYIMEFLWHELQLYTSDYKFHYYAGLHVFEDGVLFCLVDTGRDVCLRARQGE